MSAALACLTRRRRCPLARVLAHQGANDDIARVAIDATERLRAATDNLIRAHEADPLYHLMLRAIERRNQRDSDARQDTPPHGGT